MQHHYTHIIGDISEIKPTVRNNRLYFPLSLETGYVEEDGLCFGYPVDEGPYSTVTFEMAVGALADDTVSMLQTHKEREESSAKPIYLDDFVEYKNWDNTPAYQAWLKAYPAKFCETCEGECENYHHWSHEKQIAHNEIYRVRREVLDTSTPVAVIKNKNQAPQTLYKTANGDYIAHIPSRRYADMDEYFYCDLPLGESETVNLIKSKAEIVKMNNELAQKIKDNLQLLSGIFGYGGAT